MVVVEYKDELREKIRNILARLLAHYMKWCEVTGCNQKRLAEGVFWADCMKLEFSADLGVIAVDGWEYVCGTNWEGDTSRAVSAGIEVAVRKLSESFDFRILCPPLLDLTY